MSIATAIQNAQQKVANAYTAVNAKGGTLPATQDLSNLSTAIDSISTGDVWHNWKTDVSINTSTFNTPTTSNNVKTITYGNGMYVYCDGIYLYYSSDKVNWTKSTSFSHRVSNVFFVNSKFFVLSYDQGGSYYYTSQSDDGINWTTETISTIPLINGNNVHLVYGNNTYVLCDRVFAFYSSDLSSWSSTSVFTNGCLSLAYGSGIFVAGDAGNLYYSTNGSTWTTIGSTSTMNGWVTFDGSKFINRVYNGTTSVVWYSDDGINWNSKNTDISYGVIYSLYSNNIGQIFFSCYDDNQYNSTWYSLDSGTTWQLLSNSLTMNRFCYDGTINMLTGSVKVVTTVLFSQSQCYTLDATPTTSTQVYEIPKKTSSLTITAVGTGTITLSDSKVYNRNSAGDAESPVLGTKTIDTNGTYTAASDYLDGFSGVTVDIPVPPTKKYQLLDRVKDDSNNEIGTVSGFFTDANDVEYAVVCLDAQYRLASGQWDDYGNDVVPNLPEYLSTTWGPWEAKETATFNTQKILDYCDANNFTSSACNHCRSKSFNIDGTTYYGQLPNAIELNDIIRQHTAINTKDTTASTYTSLNFVSGKEAWSSSQGSSYQAWVSISDGTITYTSKTYNFFVIPVLEIPNS